MANGTESKIPNRPIIPCTCAVCMGSGSVSHHERMPQPSLRERAEWVRKERFVCHGEQGLASPEGVQAAIVASCQNDGLVTQTG